MRPYPLVFLGLVLAAAALIIASAVPALRGSDPAAMRPGPEMARAPVILPDGSALYVQRYEVTIAEWNECAAAGECGLTLRARAGHDPATTPATGFNYLDAQEYLAWINSVTGHSFRLPTVAEWSHMARSVLPPKPAPLFDDPALAWASEYPAGGLAPRDLRPQGSFSATAEGIFDLDGSVWEWTMDCYSGVLEADRDRCPAFFVGGEHVAAMFYMERDPALGGCGVGMPPAHLGMRVVSDVPV